MVYENFDLSQPLFSMEMLIWGAVIGVALAAAWAVISRRSLGLFVKRIRENRADSPETAVTLGQMGLARNPIIRMALATGKPMRRYAFCANEEEFLTKKPSEKKGAKAARKLLSLDAEETRVTDLRIARFYIPTEQMYVAEVRYDRKGTDLAGLSVSVVLLIVLGFALQHFLPQLLAMLDNFLTQMKA